MSKMHACPCCGYLTLSEKPPGTFEICSVCGWEDDYVQFNEPDFEGGANSMSLIQARENYKKLGAKSMKFIKDVRQPKPEEMPKNKNFK